MPSCRPDKSDSPPWDAFDKGVTGAAAFVLGIALSAALAIAAQRDNLRDELRRERKTPSVIVIRD